MKFKKITCLALKTMKRNLPWLVLLIIVLAINFGSTRRHLTSWIAVTDSYSLVGAISNQKLFFSIGPRFMVPSLSHDTSVYSKAPFKITGIGKARLEHVSKTEPGRDGYSVPIFALAFIPVIAAIKIHYTNRRHNGSGADS